MIVYADQLKDAAEDMGARGLTIGKLPPENVVVTAEQLATAGRILDDGPQPIANHVTSAMPGFIEVDMQTNDGWLVFQVGILPQRLYNIARDGTVLNADDSAASRSPGLAHGEQPNARAEHQDFDTSQEG